MGFSQPELVLLPQGLGLPGYVPIFITTRSVVAGLPVPGVSPETTEPDAGGVEGHHDDFDRANSVDFTG